MKVFNLICVRKSDVENEELKLTNPLVDVKLANSQVSFSFEIVFSFTGWIENSTNMLRVVIEDDENQMVFDSDYLEMPKPEEENFGILGLKLNDFEIQSYGQHTVKIIENDEVIASTIFFVSERGDRDGI